MKATCYLVLRPVYASDNKTITGFRIQRSVSRVPSLDAGEALIHVTLDADPSIFDPACVAATIDGKQVQLAVDPPE